MNRIAILVTAISVGGLYAAFRLFLQVIYPPAVSYVWQFLIGPSVAGRWPSAAQSDDQRRSSYLPTSAGQPFVFVWGMGSLRDASEGLRDGLLLGVFVALAPELVAPSLTFLAAIPLVVGAWRISRSEGSVRTDAVFDTFQKFLMYLAIVQALTLSGLLRVQS